MISANSFPNRTHQTFLTRFDGSSLLFRLTVGITLLFSIGVFSIIQWSNWNLNHIAVTTHRQIADMVTDRVAKEMSLDDNPEQEQHQLQVAVDRWSSSNVWLWVKGGKGEVLAQSRELQTTTADIRHSLLAIATPNKQPVHHMMVSVSPLSKPKHPSQMRVYVAQSMVEMSPRWQKQWFWVVVPILFFLALTWLVRCIVRRSLTPLRRINRLALLGNLTASEEIQHVPSEIRQLAEVCQQYATRLIELGQQQQQFTNHISHELRTPLSLVYGYLQSLLRRSHNLTQAQRSALEIATEEAERIIHILQNLLDQTRAENHDLHLNLQPVVLQEAVTAAAKMGKTTAHRDLQINSGFQEICAQVDRNYLVQILLHLVDCAVQYANQSPVWIDLAQTDGWAIVQIGSGNCHNTLPLAQIVPLVLPQNLNQPDEFIHHDLNLAIAHTLTTSMGGYLTICAQPEASNVLVIALPLAQPLP